jgi:hypothetical protein
MVDFVDNMFYIAPRSIKLTETSGIRKQKKGRNEEMDEGVTFFKCHLGENIAKEGKGFIILW